MTVVFLPFEVSFQCQFSQGKVMIHSGDTLEAQTVIRGTPMQMTGVMIAKDNRHRFFAEDLMIEGNAELGQQMIALFDECQIDWEDHLAQVVGDTPAYHVGRIIRGAFDWVRKTDHSFTQNVNEYVHEEANWFPSREALHDFFNDIDTLRMDVDRAEAKIRLLRQSLTEGEENL
jgi:ubiquinone biosynthesis protein UbiJ